MSALSGLGTSICTICIAVGLLTSLTPQKRTRRVMSFVIGVFLISSVVGAIVSEADGIRIEIPQPDETVVREHSQTEYTDAAAQLTANRLTEAADELLQNEGIAAEDIRLTLKISDEGRISVVRAVIYINEADSSREGDIERIIYRNLLKEPEIYVTGQAAQ